MLQWYATLAVYILASFERGSPAWLQGHLACCIGMVQSARCPYSWQLWVYHTRFDMAAYHGAGPYAACKHGLKIALHAQRHTINKTSGFTVASDVKPGHAHCTVVLS